MRIDLHQHLNFLGRSDTAFIQHQKDMGVDLTVLLPSDGNDDLKANVPGPEAAYQFTQNHDNFLFAANAPPGDQKTLATYLDKGAKLIGELKFNAPGDSPDLWSYAEVAEQYNVPVLIHFEPVLGITLDEFATTLRRFPTVRFIGHAVQWWAQMDTTQMLLREHPNLYADVSARSGHIALSHDEEATRQFFREFQTRILFGSDCSDPGNGPCHGRNTLSLIEALADKTIKENLLWRNAARLLSLDIVEPV
jgi:predicted TIM-barrel fold metal-dependent hydrolase